MRCRVAGAGAAVGVDRHPVQCRRPAGLERWGQLDLVGSDPPRGPGASAAPVVPGLEPGRGRLPGLEAGDRVEQPGVAAMVVGSEPEVLAPQAEPELTGEHPGSIAEAARVGWVAGVALLVEDRAGGLGVVGPGAAVEVGRADHRPDVVDHDGLGVDVDQGALFVLQVEDGHSRPPGADEVVDGPPLGGPGGPAGDPPVAVGMAWQHDHHAQPEGAAQGRRQGVGDQAAPQVLVPRCRPATAPAPGP